MTVTEFQDRVLPYIDIVSRSPRTEQQARAEGMTRLHVLQNRLVSQAHLPVGPSELRPNHPEPYCGRTLLTAACLTAPPLYHTLRALFKVPLRL